MSAYEDRFNPALLERIPCDAETVVDVGCFRGALGAAYKRRNPRARVFGVERDPEAARVAAERLDEVAVVDVEQVPFPFALEEVDCFVYGDSLEHLVDPWRVLTAHAQRLSNRGTLLISVPNVEHWSFAARLLTGRFDYEPQGLFDRTHLRWFTQDTMRRTLYAVGLAVHDKVDCVHDLAEAKRFVAAIAPALTALGVNPQRYLARCAPIQHVWRASRRAASQLTVISTFMDPVGGVSDVRVIEPMAAISTDPTIRAIVADSRQLANLVDTEAANGPGIIVFHRPAFDEPQHLAWLGQLIARGHLIICEFDDNPDHIPAIKGRKLLSFRAAHAVQTTTEPLAERLRLENPEIAVFPNAVKELPPPSNFRDPARLTLFFGALNREKDCAPFIDALNAAANLAGDRLAFHVVHDRAFFDELNTPNKQFTPTCPYNVYLELMSRCEIAFMPLLDNPFNRCKSDLKFLEASSRRLVSLASPMVYSASVEDGVTGLLFDSPQALQRQVLRLVAEPELARGLAQAARAYVAQHRMLAYQAPQRIAWYRSLWARRAELNATLLERLPSLGGDKASPRKAGRRAVKRGS